MLYTKDQMDAIQLLEKVYQEVKKAHLILAAAQWHIGTPDSAGFYLGTESTVKDDENE